MCRIDKRCFVLLAALVIACGCSGVSKEVRNRELSHIRAITALYARAASTLGHDPGDEAEFKSAITQLSFDPMKFGAESVDELFISERDGLPLVIFYGSAPRGVAPGVIAHEQAGVDGVRLVGFKIGQIEEADAARFAELVPNAAAISTAR